MSRDYLYLTGIIKSAQDITGYPGIERFSGEDTKGAYFYNPKLNALDGFREKLLTASSEETYDYIVNATNGIRIRNDWVESLEYEVEWNEVPLDEIIEVSTGDGNWYPMHFFKYDENDPNDKYYYAYRAGRDSETSLDLMEKVKVTSDDWENLGGKYFIIFDSEDGYYVWFNLDDSSTDPSDAGQPLEDTEYLPVEISIQTGEPANSIASKIADAIDSKNNFSASVSGDVVTIRVEEVAPVYDAKPGNSGLSVNVTVQGADVESWPMARPILP